MKCIYCKADLKPEDTKCPKCKALVAKEDKPKTKTKKEK